MAHVDLPHDGAGDLAGAGTVFKNRAFVYLWSAQTLSQLASNMVLAALMAAARRETGAATRAAPRGVLQEPRLRLPLVRPDPEPAGEQHGARGAHGDRAPDDGLRH